MKNESREYWLYVTTSLQTWRTRVIFKPTGAIVLTLVIYEQLLKGIKVVRS